MEEIFEWFLYTNPIKAILGLIGLALLIRILYEIITDK